MKTAVISLTALLQVVVGCLVSASSSEAFLPSTQHRRSLPLYAENKKGALSSSSSSSSSVSSLSTASPASNSGYVYQEADVRLYQSSTAFDSSSSLPTAGTTSSSSSSVIIQKSQGKIQKVVQSPLVQAIASATLFVVMNVSVQRVFRSTGITFPSSLAGCMVLATSLLITPNHNQIYKVLSPGAKLLQKFLMVFLVPNLIVLPLCEGCGSMTEVAKVFSIIFGGFLFSLFSTAGSVAAIRRLSQSSTTVTEEPTNTGSMSASSVTSTTSVETPKPKAFSDQLTYGARYTAIASGLLSALAGSLGHAATTPLLACSMLSSTVHNFCLGARWPKKVTKVLHPLVTCTFLTWVWAALLGAATSTSFLHIIRTYRVGGPMTLATSGAGDVLTFLLGPAVVSLGVSIYERRHLIRQNWKEVVTSTGISVVGGLFGTAVMVRILALASAELRLSLLPRNITSALAVAIAEIVGADKSLAVSFAVITGLIGANWGAGLLDTFGIKDPVARGLGIGSAAHGLGTAAFVDEKDAFPFAAISMALTAIFGTVFVSIPAIKRIAIQIALGGTIPV